MKPTRRKPIPTIIRAAIERVTGDPHQARREVVQAILDDLAANGLAITRKPAGRSSSQVRGAGVPPVGDDP